MIALVLLLGLLELMLIFLVFTAGERNKELTDALLHVRRLMKMQRSGFLMPEKASALALESINAVAPGHRQKST